MKTIQIPILMCMTLLLGALTGCATTGSQPSTIEERTQARWDALISGDFATAYQYYSPGFRSAVDLPGFERMMLRRTVAWTGAQFKQKDECNELTCKVRVVLNYRVTPRLPGAVPFEGARIIHENWIRSENNWFFVPKQ